MRVVWVIWFLGLKVFAYHSYASYKTGYGFLTLGTATATLEIDSGNYTTEVKAVATGIAAVLSGNKKETYKSVGKVIDGRLVPDQFTTINETNGAKRTKELFINHENRLITERIEDCKKTKCESRYAVLDPSRYAEDDILTLYHNVLLDLKTAKNQPFIKNAVGSKKPVEIAKPVADQAKIAKKLFGKSDGEVLIVTLNQDIFSSKKGELYIDMAKDRTTTKAVLKKTMLFGDIWGEIVEKKIKGTIDE